MEEREQDRLDTLVPGRWTGPRGRVGLSAEEVPDKRIDDGEGEDWRTRLLVECSCQLRCFEGCGGLSAD